jgi:hypothetical protein
VQDVQVGDTCYQRVDISIDQHTPLTMIACAWKQGGCRIPPLGGLSCLGALTTLSAVYFLLPLVRNGDNVVQYSSGGGFPCQTSSMLLFLWCFSSAAAHRSQANWQHFVCRPCSSSHLQQHMCLAGLARP